MTERDGPHSGPYKAPRGRTPRRGIAIVTVLVLMGGAILVATSLLVLAQAEIAGSKGAGDRAKSRALAWSGLRAAMALLDEQRDVILSGSTPSLDDEIVIYEAVGRLGVVRLLPVGPAGERLVAEAGRLDLERADAEALAATGFVDEALAQAILDHRRRLGRPFQSVAELLALPEVSAEMLYGPVEDLAADELAPAGPGSAAAAPRGLADVVTVYAFEPAIQMSGRLRINLDVPWSEELSDRIAERFGAEAADSVRLILQSGTTFESESSLFEVLNFFGVPPPEWPQIVDTFTTESGSFHFGRMDLNTAPYEALSALPGIGPEQAAAIVRVREGLSSDERATVAWPAIEGIIGPEAYPGLAGRITTRSWTYRLRLDAGEVDADRPDEELAGALVFEAVVDLSSPRPRLAYLRDMSRMSLAAEMSLRLEERGEQPQDLQAVLPGGPAPEAPQPQDAAAEPAQRRRIGRWIGG